MLVYEDLSLMEEANKEMKYLQERKEEMRKSKTKTTAGNARGDTLSTNDNSTFKSNIATLTKPKSEAQKHYSEESEPERLRPVATIIEEMDENEERNINSEEEKAEPAPKISKKIKHQVNPTRVRPNKKDSLTNIINDRNSLRKSESTRNDNTMRQRIKLPKLLVLVSKYPIYKDMEEFLKKIKENCTEYTNVPLETMVLNLVCEFPHPGDKYIVQSSFWRGKRKNIYEYETMYSLPYMDPKYMLDIVKFYDRTLMLWHLIDKVLFGKSIVMVCKNKNKLISWSEILKNLIFPFQYPGVIISYMCRPDLMLLTSNSSFIVGMLPEGYRYCKYSLPSTITIFDIDEKQMYKNKREFVQATDSEIFFSPSIQAKQKEQS